jgi:hypothetical protein
MKEEPTLIEVDETGDLSYRQKADGAPSEIVQDVLIEALEAEDEAEDGEVDFSAADPGEVVARMWAWDYSTLEIKGVDYDGGGY